MAKRKRTKVHSYLQNTTQKTKDQATRTSLKKVNSPPPFDPFYVKNSNSYIPVITLCMTPKWVFLGNALKKNLHQKQMNNAL